MMLHDAYTSGISRVLTVALLQRLKMEALIPASADCEVHSIIKFLNAQSIVPIEIHRQLCQVYDHTRLVVQHSFLLQEFGWEVFNPSVLAWVTPVTQHFSNFYCTFMKCSWEQWLQVAAVYTLYNKIIQFLVSNAWIQMQRKWFISLGALVNQKIIVVNVCSTVEITFFLFHSINYV